MAQIGDKIPQEIVATIVHWLLWFIVLFGVGIGAVVLLLIGIAKLVNGMLRSMPTILPWALPWSAWH